MDRLADRSYHVIRENSLFLGLGPYGPIGLHSVGVLVGGVAVGLEGDLRGGGALVGRAGRPLRGWPSAGVRLLGVFAGSWGPCGGTKACVSASGRFVLFDDVVDDGERVGPHAVLPRDGPLGAADSGFFSVRASQTMSADSLRQTSCF